MLKVTQYNKQTKRYESTLKPTLDQLENFDRYDLIDSKFEDHDLNNLLSRNNLYVTDWTHFNIKQQPVFYGDILISQSNDKYNTYLLMPFIHPRTYQLNFAVLYHEGPDHYFDKGKITVENLKHAAMQKKAYDAKTDQNVIIHQDPQGLNTINTGENIITLANDDALKGLCDAFSIHYESAQASICNIIEANYLPKDLTWQPLSKSLKKKLQGDANVDQT